MNPGARPALWLDAQLAPVLAPRLSAAFALDVRALHELGLRDASDLDIFMAARRAQAVLISKDADFSLLSERLGAPPRIIWLTCGNTASAALLALMLRHREHLLAWLEGGEPLIEIR